MNFWDKVIKTPTCWVWTAAKDRKGYGMFRLNGVMTKAHRWSYEQAVGPIPHSLVMDHLCRNPSCVRPDHLEPVTNRENVLRGRLYNLEKTQCPQEHPYDDDNTRICADGSRECKICRRETTRRYKARRKAA